MENIMCFWSPLWQSQSHTLIQGTGRGSRWARPATCWAVFVLSCLVMAGAAEQRDPTLRVRGKMTGCKVDLTLNSDFFSLLFKWVLDYLKGSRCGTLWASAGLAWLLCACADWLMGALKGYSCQSSCFNDPLYLVIVIPQCEKRRQVSGVVGADVTMGSKRLGQGR